MQRLYRLVCCFSIPLFLLMTGCSEPVLKMPESLPSIVREYKHITLDGDHPGMVDTGIHLNKGDAYTILATGSVDLWPAHFHAPPGYKYHDVRPEHGWAFMARIGGKTAANTYFCPLSGGNGFTQTSGSNGDLYLGIRDGPVDPSGEPLNPEYYGGNGGSFDVDVFVWKTDDWIQIADFFQSMKDKYPDNKPIICALEQANGYKEPFVAERETTKEIEKTEKQILDVKRKITVRPVGKANYNLYKNVPVKMVGGWIETNIHVSKGAIVAIIAKGEMWQASKKARWDAYKVLGFKVGKDGPAYRLHRGPYSTVIMNLGAIKSGKDGFLYFKLSGKGKATAMRSDITATVIVWDSQHQDNIEKDIKTLQRRHAKNPQFKFLKWAIAGTFTAAGDYTRSEELTGKRPSVVSAMNEYWLGHYEEAKDRAAIMYDKSRSTGNKRIQGLALIPMARAVSALGQYDEAIRLSEEALDIGKETSNMALVGSAHRSLGQSYLKKNRLDEAYHHLKKALTYFDRCRMRGNKPECYLYLGEVQVRLNKQGEAKKSFEAAIKTAQALVRVEPIWMGHSRLGRMAETEGQRQKAFEHYAQAIKVVEGMRGKLSDPGLKSTFMANKLHVYEWMIRLLTSMERDPEALNYLERAKARAMLDMLSDKCLKSGVEEENILLMRERDLRKQINELSLALLIASSDSDSEPDEQIAELCHAQEAHRDVLDSIERLNPELASLVSINPLKAREIQELLSPNVALLEYFLGEETRLVFVVTREKVLAVSLAASPEKLFNTIQRFREEAVEGISPLRSGSEDYDKTLSVLYDILVHPVEKEISHVEHLVIVPHGILHYLPFQALRTTREGKQGYLVESYAVSYLPSASVLKYARTKNKENRKNIFAAGNPTTELLPLPAAEKEAREVSALFEDKLVLTGERATENLVKTKSPHYDVVLLSTHGEMIHEDPLRSNLRFVPAPDNDGRLTVDEIFDMDIKANLVTLSACETALARGEGGGFPQGDDLVGLSRAFIHAGTPSTLASLWKVADESTVKLMQTFYRNLQSMSKAEALRQAQLELMRTSVPYTAQRGMVITKLAGYEPGTAIECSHPFFWAPFILVGDWR